MLETLIAAALVTGGVVAITRTPTPAPDLGVPDFGVPDISARDGGITVIPDLDTVPDLPCPWCHSPTDEKDHRCPSCGQRFG